MSDAIVRLRIESQEYDNKLKRATDGLTRYADECRKVGGTLSVVEQETLDYVKALGQMDTVSRTATGSLAEMKKTYTELSVQYKKLTDEEKESPFGKALAESLNQLKGRIQEAKGNLDDVNKSLTGGGGLGSALDSIAGKFGLNIKQLTGWGAALAAGKVALDVAKDAFFASESTVDEWGRTMDASKSLYEGFLTAINTGDISGYLNRIDDIVKAARTAYDELDRLGTMQRIQSPQKSTQQLENERMRMMIQTGRYIAPMDGRSNAVFNGKVMQNGDLLSAGQIRYLEQQLKGGMQKAITLITAEVKQSNKAISAFYDRQATELGLSKKEFMAGTSTMSEFDKRMAGYQQYQQWRAQHTTIDQQSGREIVARGNPYQEYAKWGAFRVDGDRYNELLQLIVQRDQQISQAYGVQSQAYRTINRAEGVTVRSIMNGGSGSGGGKTNPISKLPFDVNSAALAGSQIADRMPNVWSMLGGKGANQAMGSIIPDITADIERQILIVDELRERWKGADGDIRDGYVKQIIEAEDKLRKLKEEQSISTGDGLKPTDSNKDISTQWKVNKQGQLVQGKDLAEDGKNVAKEWQSAANAIGAVGNAMSMIEDPAAKVMGTVAQAIATIALTFSKSLEGTMTPWDWIAGAVSGAATMISTISAIHAATGYANGGIVKGNSYSGDNIGALVGGSQLVGLNAGEVVLTKAQQGSLASQLTGGGLENLHLEAVFGAEQIRLMLVNNGRRTGRGEFVTTNFR